MGNRFFKGYFEVHFERMTELEGRYAFLNGPCPYVGNNPTTEKLNPKNCFTWDMKSLFLSEGRSEKVTLKIYPQFSFNIDPFSVRIYAYSQIEGKQGMFNFVPLFPKSESDPSVLGPWEITLDINQYLKSQLSIMFFADSKVDANLGESTMIFYPREVVYPTTEANSFTLVYENATVIDPKTLHIPSVVVSKTTTTVNMLDGFVNVAQFTIAEQDVNRYGLDETRIYYLGRTTKNDDGKFIDPYSVKCAYSFADSNFATLSIDSTSTTTEIASDTYSYKVTCKIYVADSKYVLSIIGRTILYSEGKFDTYTNVNIKQTTVFSANINIYMLFNLKTSLTGGYSITSTGLDAYLSVPLSQTSQQPLSISSLFKVDLSKLSVGDNSNPEINSVSMGVEGLLPNLNYDPFSFRVFGYNEEKRMFELLCPDIPSSTRVNFQINFGNLVQSNTNFKVFALAYYNNINEKVGEIVYVNYQRIASFNPTPTISFYMEFEMLYDESFIYSNRPYFTLNPYIPDTEALSDWTIVYSVMQQNGNGLETYNFDERRVFSISFDYEQLDSDGNTVPIKFTDLTCVYLFKESNFKNAEVSVSSAVVNNDNNEVVIRCEEDIRDESFVFMIAAPKFQPTIIPIPFDISFQILSTTQFYTKMVEYDLPEDILTISFNPSGRSTGYYQLSRDTRNYNQYSIPQTSLKPLRLIGTFIADFTSTNLYSSSRIDTEAFLKYEKKSNVFNFDPFSYKFFSVDDINRKYDWLNCDDGRNNKPWNVKIDMSLSRRFKFAIFAYTNEIGQFDTFYSIHYDRSLTYSLGNNQKMELSFTSPSFPQLETNVLFVLQEENHPSPNIGKDQTIVKASSIVQTVSNDISTRRVFHYSTDLIDINGNAITDLLSLKCVYVASGKTIFGEGIIRNDSSTFSLECSDILQYEFYDWIIVANGNMNPVPIFSNKPQPSHHVIQPSHENNSSAAIVVLSLIVTLLLVVIVVLIVLVVYFAVFKKKLSEKERIFNFEEMSQYNSTNSTNL